jgi:hypothetical protein
VYDPDLDRNKNGSRNRIGIRNRESDPDPERHQNDGDPHQRYPYILPNTQHCLQEILCGLSPWQHPVLILNTLTGQNMKLILGEFPVFSLIKLDRIFVFFPNVLDPKILDVEYIYVRILFK